MGSEQSQPEVEPYETPEMNEEMQKVLDDHTYWPSDDAKYPYFLIQLDEDGELHCGENDDILMSDCIAAWIAANPVTHIIAQTHGWNTPPDKAVAVPFSEFMSGMQNDTEMPTEDFNPVWVAFIWPAVPLAAAKADDALTRAELIIQNEQNRTKSGNSDIKEAAEAAKKAMEDENPDDEDLQAKLAVVSEHMIDDDDDDDDEVVAAIKNGEPEVAINRAKESAAGPIIEGALSIFRPIMRPLETLVFGRLMKRGRNCGKFMGEVLKKLMSSADGRPKVTLMANSLGAHMLVGAMKQAPTFPYKVHAVFFVQGAINRFWFGSGGRYKQLKDFVAGPIVATYSERDYLLKNVFGPFHGDALGFEGFSDCNIVEMKSLEELQESSYEFVPGSYNSIDGSNFIDEGDAFAGGHGDFKEDETTTLYWSMIKMQVDDSAYEK